MNHLIKFEPAKLPAKADAIRAIDQAQTINEVKDIDALFEAARAYAAKIKDVYAQADADEVKQYALRKIGLMYERQKNPIGTNQYSADSGPESASTRQIESSVLSAYRLQQARVVGRMSPDDFHRHLEDRRDRIIFGPRPKTLSDLEPQTFETPLRRPIPTTILQYNDAYLKVAAKVRDFRLYIEAIKFDEIDDLSPEMRNHIFSDIEKLRDYLEVFRKRLSGKPALRSVNND